MTRRTPAVTTCKDCPAELVQSLRGRPLLRCPSCREVERRRYDRVVKRRERGAGADEDGAARGPVVGVCPVCLETFTGSPRRVYCSTACKQRHKRQLHPPMPEARRWWQRLGVRLINLGSKP
jgi:hypothetical protein